jgi:hypothetical protein
MRGLHLWVGLLAVVVFLITGQFMRHHHPPMSALSDASRLMLRSRHIYILAAGSVNVILGLYVQRIAGWRGVLQAIGSGLLMVPAVFLILAFILETAKGFQPEMAWSRVGLYGLFAGCMLHLAPTFRWVRRVRRYAG